MPAAKAKFRGIAIYRMRLDLPRYTQGRFISSVVVVGFVGSSLRLQYLTDGGTTRKFPAAAGHAIDVAGIKIGAWVSIAGAASTDVLGLPRDGTVSPQFGSKMSSFK